MDRTRVIDELVDRVRETMRPVTVPYEVALRIDDLLKQIETTTDFMRVERREAATKTLNANS